MLRNIVLSHRTLEAQAKFRSPANPSFPIDAYLFTNKIINILII